MNIKEAKEQIKYTLTAYFTKNAYGEFEIPLMRQRPVFLMGPPGIGKTAIMEQIASEMGVGLVSYSMTHHTRQSALGLPFIIRKNYCGREVSVSEYTMSEIIASVYDMIEESGVKEGILFLDEINCVSETLAPAMLQFLQYKIFGRHRVPEGWIVVTAGNPPEYNNSVRDFDIVTWDRLKRIDIEPDFSVWKEYALSQRVHPAILTYLEIRRDDFYRIETTVDGKTFVTARGWVDLSGMIRLYEKNDLPVGEALVGQYLQNPAIARDFALYYDLFIKYRSDYQVEAILAGNAPADIKGRAIAAAFDERLSLIGLMFDSLSGDFSKVCETEAMLRILLSELKPLKENFKGREDIEDIINKLSDGATCGKLSGSKSSEELHTIKSALSVLKKLLETMSFSGEKDFSSVNESFNGEKQKLRKLSADASSHLENAFSFLSEVFGSGREMLIFVTGLTADKKSASFISRYGSESYFRYNKELMVYERQKEIIKEIEDLELTD